MIAGPPPSTTPTDGTDKEPVARPSTRRSATQRLVRPRALVVDREFLTRWTVRNHLRGQGYEVREATTAAEARALFSLAPDLVLLAMRLPDADGVDLLAELLNLRPGLPVIMMSAQFSADRAERARAIGACGLVQKPIDTAVLAERLAIIAAGGRPW